MMFMTKFACKHCNANKSEKAVYAYSEGRKHAKS